MPVQQASHQVTRQQGAVAAQKGTFAIWMGAVAAQKGAVAAQKGTMAVLNTVGHHRFQGGQRQTCQGRAIQETAGQGKAGQDKP